MPTKFTIDGHHVEVTPALEQYVIQKLNKVVTIFGDKITSVHVVLTVEKLNHKADAELKIAGDKNSIFAQAVTEDLYQSIDKLEDKLYAQVDKYHGKLVDHERHRK